MKPVDGISLAVLAVLAAGCGSAGTRTVTVTSTAASTSTSTTATPSASASATTAITSASATTSSPPAAAIVHLATFKSPTGNIGCMIIAGTARCDIQQRSWSPPPTPKSCPPVVNFGQGLIVTGSGPGRLVCAGDTSRDPAAAPVPYGTDTIVGSFRCASRSTGMTCTNTDTGHGFFISFQSYRAF